MLCVALTSVCPPEQFPQVKEPQKTLKTTWNVSRKVSAGFTFLFRSNDSQNFANMQSQSISIADASTSNVHIFFVSQFVGFGMQLVSLCALPLLSGLTNETSLVGAVGAS